MQAVDEGRGGGFVLKTNIKTGLTFLGRYGSIPCMCHDCGRVLGQPEIDVTFISDGGGGVDSKGSAECKICRNRLEWDQT